MPGRIPQSTEAKSSPVELLPAYPQTLTLSPV